MTGTGSGVIALELSVVVGGISAGGSIPAVTKAASADLHSSTVF